MWLPVLLKYNTIQTLRLFYQARIQTCIFQLQHYYAWRATGSVPSRANVPASSEASRQLVFVEEGASSEEREEDVNVMSEEVKQLAFIISRLLIKPEYRNLFCSFLLQFTARWSFHPESPSLFSPNTFLSQVKCERSQLQILEGL